MKITKSKTIKEIIDEIGELNIFRFYIPNLKLNKPILSIFRNEKHPSFVVYENNGKIKYKDFGDSNYYGDALNLVRQLFNLNTHEAILKVQEDFKHGEFYRVIQSLPKIKEAAPRKLVDIRVMPRKFNNEELKYWSDYYQDIEDLKSENIYVPKAIWINKQKITLLNNELTFCYYYPEIDKWKIYKPFASKSQKWKTNCPFNYIEHLKEIKDCDIVIANKSKKDYLVLKKALGMSCIVTTQAEDVGCWTEESINYLKQNSKVQYCSADNDNKGVSYSWIMTERHGFKHINVPYNIADLRKKGKFISDWSDWARDYGLEVVTNHFKSKGIC